MKANKRQSIKGKWSIVAFCAVVVMVALFVGVMVAYNKLRDLYLEQCVIVDVTRQVEISSGKMVKGDIIAEEFGLRNGANLGLIDYDEKRKAILKKIPNIRSIVVTRHLPDRVTIQVEERRPVVRMNVVGARKETVRVADTDGMVFRCQRNTGLLPIVREAREKVTSIGSELKGRSLAALRLWEVAHEGDAAAMGAKLGILEVDASQRDYLVATLGDYSQAKIAWEGMDQPTESNRKNLEMRLKMLREALAAAKGLNVRVWNVTLDNRVYADKRELLP